MAKRPSSMEPSHPYYPLGVEIVGYVANDHSVPVLLAIFAAGCATIFAVTLAVVRRVQPSLRASDQITVLWFVLSSHS